MKRILAIDPGMSGGLAHFAGNRVTLEPMPTTDRDIRDVLVNFLSQSDVCYIEKVGGYIGGKGAPGSAMFNYGRNVGFLHGLMAATHGAVAYETGTTHAFTTAAEAFAQGRGVCQDHAHVFIGLARANNIPARYVTGYLMADDVSPAAHAWAEALVPDLGWVGFDAANAKCPTDHYVRVASGLDAAGTAPLRGCRRGGQAEQMTVEVRVEISQQ